MREQRKRFNLQYVLIELFFIRFFFQFQFHFDVFLFRVVFSSSRCYSQSFAFTTKTKKQIHKQNNNWNQFAEWTLFRRIFVVFFFFCHSDVWLRMFVWSNDMDAGAFVFEIQFCYYYIIITDCLFIFPSRLSIFINIFSFVIFILFSWFCNCSLYTLFDLLKPFHMFPLYTMKMFSILKRSNNDSATKKRNFSFQLHKTWHPDIWIVYIDQININLREKSSIHLSFALIVYTVSPTLKLYMDVVSLGLKIDFTIVQKQNSFDFIVFSLFCHWFFEYFFLLFDLNISVHCVQ